MKGCVLAGRFVFANDEKKLRQKEACQVVTDILPPMDDQGYLLDPADWSEDLARSFAIKSLPD